MSRAIRNEQLKALGRNGLLRAEVAVATSLTALRAAVNQNQARTRGAPARDMYR